MEEFKSKLQVEPLINYNKEFESEKLNETDITKMYFYIKYLFLVIIIILQWVVVKPTAKMKMLYIMLYI